MKILFCTSEFYPLFKTGGLADVSNALPTAWANNNQSVTVILPAYTSVLNKLQNKQSLGKIKTPFGKHEVEILISEDFKPVKLVLIKSPIFENKINPYIDENGKEWHDNFLRFAILGWISAQLSLPTSLLKTKFNVVVSNDWQTGILQAYIYEQKQKDPKFKIETAHIIHNIAFPGIFPAQNFYELQLPTEYFNLYGVEYHGHISFQKAALFYANKIITVSPNYAQEIKNSHEFGMGFEGLLNDKKNLIGILNGVDYKQWHPENDTLISQQFNAKTIDEKEKNKTHIKKALEFKNTDNKRLLVGAVSRITSQKGFDIFCDFITNNSLQHIDFIIFGTGDTYITENLKKITYNNDNFKFIDTYDEKIAHQIIAGSDVLLIPSKFEPCGLTQMFAMAYGTLPIVNPIGGLKDTVINFDENEYKNSTGFYLNALSVEGFKNVFEKVNSYFQNKKLWKIVMKNAMKKNFSWDKTQKIYLQYFKQNTDN